MSATNFGKCDGINHQRSQMRMADITDGTSNIYLVGEKYLDPDQYFTGVSINDDEPALGADDIDLHDWTCHQPFQDTAGSTSICLFGSAHSTGFHMAFCDGSVRR